MKWSIMSLVTADLGVVDMREVEIIEAPTWNEFLKYVKKNYKVVKQDKRSGMILFSSPCEVIHFLTDTEHVINVCTNHVLVPLRGNTFLNLIVTSMPLTQMGSRPLAG